MTRLKSKRVLVGAVALGLAAVTAASVLLTAAMQPWAKFMKDGDPISVQWGYVLVEGTQITDLKCTKRPRHDLPTTDPSKANNWSYVYQELDDDMTPHVTKTTRPNHAIQLMGTKTDSNDENPINPQEDSVFYCVQNGIQIINNAYHVASFVDNASSVLGLPLQENSPLYNVFAILSTWMNPAELGRSSAFDFKDSDYVAALQCLLWEFSCGVRTVNDLIDDPVDKGIGAFDATDADIIAARDPLRNSPNSKPTGKPGSARAWMFNGGTFGGQHFSPNQYYQTILWNFYGPTATKRPAYYFYYAVLNYISIRMKQPKFVSDTVREYTVDDPYGLGGEYIEYKYTFEVTDKDKAVPSFANYADWMHSMWCSEVKYYLQEEGSSEKILLKVGGKPYPELGGLLPPGMSGSDDTIYKPVEGVKAWITTTAYGFSLVSEKPLTGKYTVTAIRNSTLNLEAENGGGNEYEMHLAVPDNGREQVLITGYPNHALFSFTVHIDHPNGYFRIQKESQEGCEDIVTGNSLYSLKGAEYAVYSADGTYKGTFITEADGRTAPIEVQEGSYYAVETKAPPGHALVSEKKSFTVSRMASAAEAIIVTFTNPIVHDPLSLNGFVDKDWSERKAN